MQFISYHPDIPEKKYVIQVQVICETIILKIDLEYRSVNVKLREREENPGSTILKEFYKGKRKARKADGQKKVETLSANRTFSRIPGLSGIVFMALPCNTTFK